MTRIDFGESLAKVVRGRPDRARALRDFGISPDESTTLELACLARGIDSSAIHFTFWTLDQLRASGQEPTA